MEVIATPAWQNAGGANQCRTDTDNIGDLVRYVSMEKKVKYVERVEEAHLLHSWQCERAQPHLPHFPSPEPL